MFNSDYLYDMEEDCELFSVYDEDLSSDLKYRSITVQANPSGDYFLNYQHPSSGSKMVTETQHVIKPVIAIRSSSFSSSTGCPAAPFGMANTNFNIASYDYEEVVRSVSICLNSLTDYDFSFIGSDHMVNIH